MKLLSWNIQWGRGMDGRVDLTRILRTIRKLGDFDEALEYYQKALAIDADHVGANEYLGELYLQMKDLPKAEERLKVLTEACNGCEEQEELEQAIADYKANNS